MLGHAHHAVWDAIGPPGSTLTVRAKLEYGEVAKALEHETARLYVDEPDGWKLQGEAETDDDGVVTLAVVDKLAPGTYPAVVEAVGDGSWVHASVWVVPTTTHLVVFDIDGTLTTDDGQVVLQFLGKLVNGSYTPKSYPSAAELTRAHAAKGEVPVYLTGRPPILDGPTRDWLEAKGFAPGVVHVTEKMAQTLPSQDGVGAFKAAFLKELVNAGYTIDFAYGNATTDIFAYDAAGIASTNVFIIGKHAGEGGTNAAHDSWQLREADVRGGK